jgi:hypothetical protein
MSSRLGPIDIDCDAPPYRIVEACERLGFVSPLDVRWYRISRFPSAQDRRPRRAFGFHLWNSFFRVRPSEEKTCTCGQPLPRIENYTFTFSSRRHAQYLVGQCRRCWTIYWDETATVTSGRGNQEESSGI